MDRGKMTKVLRQVDDAVNATVGYTHVQALGIEGKVNLLARRYAEEVMAGEHEDKAAPSMLIHSCESMLGVLGLRPKGVRAVDYASAMVQWHIDRIKEDGR